jgi:hypothetical protein
MNQTAASRARELDFKLKEQAEKCRWFARCTNKATTITPHSVLGNVPTCQKCHDFATKKQEVKRGL